MPTIKHVALLAVVATAGATAVALAVPGSAGADPVAGNLYAQIDAAGGLVAGNGVVSSTSPATGQYEVSFDRDVSGCAYVATTHHIYSQAVQAYTAGGHDSTAGVYVEVKNQGGGLTDGSFDLVVDCGTSATPFAVVGYTANLVRSSTGVSLASPGSGRYNVTFPSVVSSCAALATVGDPSNALVFDPAGVYTGTGPNGKTIYVETKNPGGGLQDGVPFHLVLMCPGATDVHAAVVASDGITARFVNNTLSYRRAGARYVLVTQLVITNCATIGTRGSTGRAVPFTPSTVEIEPGPASNTIGLQTRKLLFFGGGLNSQAFHAAVVC